MNEFYKSITKQDLGPPRNIISLIEWNHILKDKIEITTDKTYDNHPCIFWKAKYDKIAFRDIRLQRQVNAGCRRFFYERFVRRLTDSCAEHVKQVCGGNGICVQPHHLVTVPVQRLPKRIYRKKEHVPYYPAERQPYFDDLRELFEENITYKTKRKLIDISSDPPDFGKKEDYILRQDRLQKIDEEFKPVWKLPKQEGESESDTDSIISLPGSDG